jgi:hypothetical protein
MEYQQPEMEITLLNTNIVRTSSLAGETGGTGENVGGDGTQPWE